MSTTQYLGLYYTMGAIASMLAYSQGHKAIAFGFAFGSWAAFAICFFTGLAEIAKHFLN